MSVFTLESTYTLTRPAWKDCQIHCWFKLQTVLHIVVVLHWRCYHDGRLVNWHDWSLDLMKSLIGYSLGWEISVGKLCVEVLGSRSGDCPSISLFRFIQLVLVYWQTKTVRFLSVIQPNKEFNEKYRMENIYVSLHY